MYGQETLMTIKNLEAAIDQENTKCQILKETNKLNVMIKFEKDKTKVLEQLKLIDEMYDKVMNQTTLVLRENIEVLKKELSEE